MIDISEVYVDGWEAAIRGMRNPMNSWSRSDTIFWVNEDPELGDRDLGLMMNLVKSGTDHSKFRRMITVSMDILAPLYWWKEFDTYKVGTVANSCSTMHKIHVREFIMDDFSHEHLQADSLNSLKMIMDILNYKREEYLKSLDKRYWWQLIQLLPSSYNQKRTVMLNYEVLANIYKSRRSHKLDEWREFCKMVETLPYSEVITGEIKTDS